MAFVPFTSEPSKADLEDNVAADSILQSLESLAAGEIPASLRDNEEKRLRFLEAARMASFKLEQPWDTMQRLIFCALPPNMVQAGIDLGLWRLLSEREGTAMSVSELAAELGAEEAFLVRMLRWAATQWMVEQVGLERYRATNITKYLSMSGLESVMFHVTERNIKLYNAIPKWLAENSYKQPQDNKNLPFNLGMQTDLHFFEWLSQRPRHQQAFNEYMSFQRVGQKSWLDVFPLETYPRTLFAREVLRRFPELQGPAIESAKSIEGLKVAQPIKGACVYYMRNILHDWPDQACYDILSQLKEAMAPDSDLGAHWYGASFDLLMMANYGARERSLAEWDRILDKVGLERKTFVPYSMHGDSVQIVGVRGVVHERL
ncbi:S-adenosyl-L-methionine-dependent methyltransferase [Corynespora cassiicola Philippines]|uniref:S-adenosyl-L-methionine-dependent methyltransferase n=1 Tax=Corynespora cassiicola Philippines TaxID=1448308 RepID=A0A2T2PD47_CORCC|nr:S-adenosyl-L-methionine-dependent methyltransferase [Corynespora cassiicola Philippines]